MCRFSCSQELKPHLPGEERVRQLSLEGYSCTDLACAKLEMSLLDNQLFMVLLKKCQIPNLAIFLLMSAFVGKY